MVIAVKRYAVLLAAVWLMLTLAWVADASEPQPIAQATVTVTRGDLNGRQRPDIRSPKVAWYKDGEIISIYEISGEWALTDGSEYGTCWVNINYLTTDNAGTYVVNSNGRLRIRNTPNGDTIGWLKPGQTINVLAIFGGWARTDNGWVMAEFLQANK